MNKAINNVLRIKLTETPAIYTVRYCFFFWNHCESDHWTTASRDYFIRIFYDISVYTVSNFESNWGAPPLQPPNNPLLTEAA
jgi:hypothetical protein